MLIITRRPGDVTEIGGDLGEGQTLFDRYGNPVFIEISQLGVKGNQVRIGIECKITVPVHRGEIAKRIREDARQSGKLPAANGNVAEAVSAG